MKILLVLPHLKGGGAERITVNLANSLSALGHEVTLLVVKDVGVYFNKISVSVKTIIVTKCKARLDLYSGISALYKLTIHARKSDIVIACLEGWPTILCYIASRLSRKPCVGWVHTSLMSHAYNSWGKSQIKILKSIYSKLNAVVCVSHGSLESFREFVGSDHSRTMQKVIYNSNAYPIVSAPKCSNSETPIVLSVGRLYIKQKGFDLLLEAHKRLIDKKILHKLIILGDGPDKVTLKAMINSLGLSNSVELHGFQDNIVDWYDNSHVFALASRYEGFGLVIVEALARGIPVVTTDCDGPREILSSGEYGIIVDKENVESLAKGIELALTNNTLRDRNSTLGLARAQDFNTDTIVKNWDLFLKEVLNV